VFPLLGSVIKPKSKVSGEGNKEALICDEEKGEDHGDEEHKKSHRKKKKFAS